MIPLKVEASLTLALLQRVRDMRAEGQDVASFAAGEPDFDTPSVVVEAAYAAMKAGETRYVATPGIPTLREAVAEDYRTRLKSPWVKSANVLISAGAKQGIYLTMQGLLETGDEVLVVAPYWVSYPHIVHVAGGHMVEVPALERDGFFPTVETLEKHYGPKTKALIFASPGNPTGGMIKEAALREIIAWCVKRKVVLIYDEIYERLELTSQKHVCPLALVDEASAEFVVAVNAFSKSLAMTGWRLGYLVSHAKNIENLSALHGQMLTSLPGFIQSAAVAGIAHADRVLKPVITSYQKRLKIMLEGFSKIPNVRTHEPTGAFYVCVDVTKVMKSRGVKTDGELAELLLQEQKVVVLPGDNMGMPGWLRFSFATSEEEIQKGLERFTKFCAR